MGLGRILGLFTWIIGRSGVGLAGLAVLFPRLGRGQGVNGLSPYSGSGDLFGVLFLPFSFV